MPEPVTYRGMTLLVPDNDSEWKEFYAHARAHRLVVRRCAVCGLLRYPPSHACPWCMDLGWAWHEVSGRGTIYSYAIVHHAIQPGFKALTPYPVVLVELDEQRGRELRQLLSPLAEHEVSTVRPHGAKRCVRLANPVRMSQLRGKPALNFTSSFSVQLVAWTAPPSI